MAVFFNGTTGKIVNTTASGFDVETITICVWVNIIDTGEAAAGRVFVADEATNSLTLSTNATDNLAWRYTHSVANGTWTIPVTHHATDFHAVALSYDRSSVLNNPVARVNFADVTVTETSTPIGTPTSPNTGYCVGNVTADTNTWSGRIAQLQVFNRILTAGEMDQALWRPGSVQSGMVLWLPLWHSTDVNDYSGGARHGTGSNVGVTGIGPWHAPLFSSDEVVPYMTKAKGVSSSLNVIRTVPTPIGY